MIQLQEDTDVNKEQGARSDKNESNKTRSAFRTVQQDGTTPMTPAVSDSDGLSKDVTMRAAKIKQKAHSSGGPTSSFLPPYTQYAAGPTMVNPTSPRLVPDSLLFGNPHGTNLYHHAFRGAGYHGIPQLPRNLMQYRILPPPGTGNPAQSPLAGLPIQSQLLMQDFAGKLFDKKSRLPEENGVSRKRRRSSNEQSDDRSNHSVFSDDEIGSPKKENGHSERTNHVSVIHKSPANSPLTIDGSDVKNSGSCGRLAYDNPAYRPHRLIPKLRLNMDENIVHWDVDQVCEFISSLTGSPEVVSEFREQCIDGQSLILLKEDHLLNKLGIKLGPALKILAHIQKLLERTTTDDHGTDVSD
ncbi:hypothetical protein QZH41_014672 [Actinostola sp. cb2023]|nr:hypothetical protein QZH41_014672 [Actinostola sp. cb2023]